MEDGDHSECSIELIACTEHRDQQLLAIGYKPGQAIESPSADPEAFSMFQDENGNPTVGFCLWCGKDFYSMDEVQFHNDDGMAACAVAQELKDEQCMPPVLQTMFETAGFVPRDGADDQE